MLLHLDSHKIKANKTRVSCNDGAYFRSGESHIGGAYPRDSGSDNDNGNISYTKAKEKGNFAGVKDILASANLCPGSVNLNIV